MEDYWNLNSRKEFYLGWTLLPNYKSDSVNLDSKGFRKTLKSGSQIFIENTTANNLTLVSGNSFSFGVGSSCDEYAIPSLLNISNSDFLNISVRGYNLEQELTLLKYFCRNLKFKLITISGINDILWAGVWNGRFMPHFYKFNGVFPKVNFGEKVFFDNLEWYFQTNLKLLSELEGQSSKPFYFLQPVRNWGEKIKSSYGMPDEMTFLINGLYEKVELQRVIKIIKRACQTNNITFVDLNKHSLGPSLFCDELHCNDNGYKHFAKVILDYVENS